MAVRHEIDPSALAPRLERIPGFGPARSAAERSGVEAYVVGGAVRDALLGRQVDNLDVVVVGEPDALIAALGGETRVYDRFGTATVQTPDGSIDVARARAEIYERPGALPSVRPAGLDEDLARRDFSVNAIAVPVGEPDRLVDPHRGVDDLGAGVLRVLHERSFADDPTRALRAARYGARLGLEPEPATLELLRHADFATVSADRVDAELRRLAAELSPRGGFELLDTWELVPLPAGAAELIDAVASVCEREPWRGEVDRAAAVLAAARGPAGSVRELAELEPASPSEAVAAAHGHDVVGLTLARALGAAWLDDYLSNWRDIRLEITGKALLEAGIPEGPAVGRGLAAALRAKLDGETDGREAELESALEAARRA